MVGVGCLMGVAFTRQGYSCCARWTSTLSSVLKDAVGPEPKGVTFVSGDMRAGCKTFRLLSTSAVVQRKNVAASGPEKYTEAFIKKQIEEFDIGKRHLANMMGEEPETLIQKDIDRAICYLFPSGLFDKRARPIMKHPSDIFPKQRAIQWGADGRPFHFLFYTGKQSYYSLMHDTYGKYLDIQKHQDRMRDKGLSSEGTKQISIVDSRWLIKEELEEMIVEKISTHDFVRFIHLLERLLTLPYCAIEEEYVLRFRKVLELEAKKQVIAPLQYNEQGVAFSAAEGRKNSSRAKAILYDCGKGRITVNGVDYLQYFPVLQDREQLMFPFQFLDRLGKHDMECTASEGGRSSQASAIRLAASRALLSFVTENEMECMRQAGLLTADPRVKERQKPGQEGARRKFTWKKR